MRTVPIDLLDQLKMMENLGIELIQGFLLCEADAGVRVCKCGKSHEHEKGISLKTL